MPPTSERTLREWRSRVAAEYRSAAITAQLLHWLIQAGLDPALVDTALRIVRDELDHAALSHDVLLALGALDAPAPVQLETLAEPLDPGGVLPSLLDSALRNFCLGETFAVPLFQAMRAGTTHPEAKAALDRILRDEAVHRAFGWTLLDALLEIDADAVRARSEAKLPALLETFRRGYAPDAATTPITDDERAVGLLDLAEYRRVYGETVDDLRRRFGKRGIHVPAAITSLVARS